MKTNLMVSTALAALLVAGASGAAFAQTATDQDHTAHHPDQAGQAEQAPAVQPETPAAPGGGVPGMGGMMGGGMMGPGMGMNSEMMQMMHRMMAMQQGEEAQPGTGMGRSGAMLCPMMQTAVQPAGRVGSGMGGPAVMPGGMNLLHGNPQGAQQEMTPDKVRAMLDRWLAWNANPRLKLGGIAETAEGNITAEIVTVDGSLVQKLAFNRYPGLFRQVP